jgi:hypothetical protein
MSLPYWNATMWNLHCTFHVGASSRPTHQAQTLHEMVDEIGAGCASARLPKMQSRGLRHAPSSRRKSLAILGEVLRSTDGTSFR